MELKRISFKIAKAIKEAGYQQGHLTEVYLMSAIEKELAYREFGLFPKDYFPGELVSADSYRKYDIETCDAPTYLEVWLWLWREKRFPIDAECMEKLQKEVAPNMWENGILTERYDDPEEAIISAIDYLIDNNLIK